MSLQILVIIFAIPIVMGFLVLFVPKKTKNLQNKVPVIEAPRKVFVETIKSFGREKIMSQRDSFYSQTTSKIPEDPLPNYKIVLGSPSIAASVSGTYSVSAIPLTEMPSVPRYKDGDSHYGELEFINDNLTNLYGKQEDSKKGVKIWQK